MSEFIPPAPEAATRTDDSGSSLASQWIRLVAQIIDGIIVAIPGAIILSILSSSSSNMLNHILMMLISYGLLIGINWNFLQNGQTIGKKLLGIKIVRKDGSLADRHHILTKRIAPVGIAAVVPYIGPLALILDALCIFRPGFNTLHDDYADTKVIMSK
jgi:uncharacterized RDD family membrane protein YckC